MSPSPIPFFIPPLYLSACSCACKQCMSPKPLIRESARPKQHFHQYPPGEPVNLLGYSHGWNITYRSQVRRSGHPPQPFLLRRNAKSPDLTRSYQVFTTALVRVAMTVKLRRQHVTQRVVFTAALVTIIADVESFNDHFSCIRTFTYHVQLFLVYAFLFLTPKRKQLTRGVKWGTLGSDEDLRWWQDESRSEHTVSTIAAVNTGIPVSIPVRHTSVAWALICVWVQCSSLKRKWSVWTQLAFH